MTLITIQSDRIVFDGHAGKSEVCSGLSVISQMVANYLSENKNSKVSIQNGYLQITSIPDDFFYTDLGQAMTMALEDIVDQYPEYVQIRR